MRSVEARVHTQGETKQTQEYPLPDIRDVLDKFSADYYPEMVRSLPQNASLYGISSPPDGYPNIPMKFDRASVALLFGVKSFVSRGEQLVPGGSTPIEFGDIQGELVRRTTENGFSLHFTGDRDCGSYSVSGEKGRDGVRVELFERRGVKTRRMKTKFTDGGHTLVYAQENGEEFVLATGTFRDDPQGNLQGGSFGVRVFRGKDTSSYALDAYKKE